MRKSTKLVLREHRYGWEGVYSTGTDGSESLTLVQMGGSLLHQYRSEGVHCSGTEERESIALVQM